MADMLAILKMLKVARSELLNFIVIMRPILTIVNSRTAKVQSLSYLIALSLPDI